MTVDSRSGPSEVLPDTVAPAPVVSQPARVHRSANRRDVVRLTVRGRSLALPGMHVPPAGVLGLLALLGPGLVAALAGDDAGGIATYSATGAQFGYDLLWVLIPITIALAVVQEMCGRLGAASGRGLLDLIRERFGIGWTLLAVVVVLLANGGVTITEFVGIGAALELFGITRYVSVPLAAALIWYFMIGGSYRIVERVFLVMTLVFIAYPIAAIVAHPDWAAVVRGTFVPTFHNDPTYIALLVGLIGTSITPYMQLFQQSAVVEKGVARRDYGPERADTYVGAVFANLIAWFIIIATAATLHVAGSTRIQTAADAAQALQPVAGAFAGTLFGVGLLGSSLLAAGVLPLATAYSVSEAFGFRRGLNLDFRRARMFMALFTLLIMLGAAAALLPGLPVIQLLVWIQVLNGLMLPVVLVFIMLLANNPRVTSTLRNHTLANVLGWATVVLVTLADLTLLGTQLLGLFGINLFG